MNDLLEVLKDRGPLLGKDLAHCCGMDTFQTWKVCSTTKGVETRIVGKRYLRLDARVEDYARLSPSIMREFLNYTVVGPAGEQQKLDALAEKLQEEIAAISKKKIDLARETIGRLIAAHREHELILKRTCFIIAGDVVFDMAHAEPRPESSTGELVKGSDLDVIAVTDGLPAGYDGELDALLYRGKYNLLLNPALKEELDYIVKNLQTVREQLAFKDFKAMVASKILWEGRFLLGSMKLFERIKDEAAGCGIPEKLGRLEEKAHRDRDVAEKLLLAAPAGATPDRSDHDELMTLFYTTEEKEEIF